MNLRKALITAFIPYTEARLYEGSFMRTNLRSFFLCLAMFALCISLCACDSDNVKNAREAYNASKYAEAIELLNSEENLSNSAKELLGNSRAQLAKEQGNYSNAIGELIAVNKSPSDTLYKEILQCAVEDANTTGNSEHLTSIIKQDSSNAASIYEALQAEAVADNIMAYQAMDGISSSEDIEEAVREQFISFINENGEQRARAFLLGTWEWSGGEGAKTKVEIKPQGDGLIGIMTQVGDDLTKYQLQTGDVYWTDYIFLEPTQFTCKNLTKTTNGVPVPCTAVGTIDFGSSNKLALHLTSDIGLYHVINPDRVWTRAVE